MLCDKNDLPLNEATYNTIRSEDCNVFVVMRNHGADSESNRHGSAYNKDDLESKWVSL